MEKYVDKKFTLILAGGEPLLNFSLIEEVYKYIDENPHYSCKIGLQTNGTLITEEIARKLAIMKNLNIGVSFDMDMETNEYLRGRSIDTIRGIKLLGKFRKTISINSVITNKNINNLEKLVDFSYYLGNVNAIGLDLLRLSGNSLLEKNSDISVVEDIEIYKNLKKASEKINFFTELTGKKIIIRELEEAKYRLKDCSNCINDNYCYSSLGEAMVVLPNGDSYPCSSFVGNNKYFMGNVLEEDKQINFIKLNSGKYKKCEFCEYKNICKGCCPSRMIFNESFNLEDKDCILRKAIFKILKES